MARSLLSTHSVTGRRIVPLALLFSLSWIPQASAQLLNGFALGMEFKVKTSDRASHEDYAEGQLGPGLLWRFGNPKQGWGFHWGLNWYGVTIQRPVGGAEIELGELHVRPIMAGYGYTKTLHHWSFTADVLGGYAIASIDLDGPAVDAYRRAFNVPGADASASNTFVLKPEFGMWYDLNNKFGINVNAGYMMARPDVTVTMATGTETRTVRADQFILKAGVVYSIFPKRKSSETRTP